MQKHIQVKGVSFFMQLLNAKRCGLSAVGVSSACTGTWAQCLGLCCFRTSDICLLASLPGPRLRSQPLSALRQLQFISQILHSVRNRVFILGRRWLLRETRDAVPVLHQIACLCMADTSRPLSCGTVTTQAAWGTLQNTLVCRTP
jgi:hypothetical protein